MGRKIVRHSLVDTEHQENQWALWAFLRQGTTTANLVSDKDASTLHQIKKDWIKIGLSGGILPYLKRGGGTILSYIQKLFP